LLGLSGDPGERRRDEGRVRQPHVVVGLLESTWPDVAGSVEREPAE
jgi:hypothetical protein